MDKQDLNQALEPSKYMPGARCGSKRVLETHVCCLSVNLVAPCRIASVPHKCLHCCDTLPQSTCEQSYTININPTSRANITRNANQYDRHSGGLGFQLSATFSEERLLILRNSSATHCYPSRCNNRWRNMEKHVAEDAINKSPNPLLKQLQSP